MFIKLRDIALGRELYHLFFYPHIHYRIAFDACAPAVSPFGAREIDGITSLSLADKYAIAKIDGVDASFLVCVGHAVV